MIVDIEIKYHDHTAARLAESVVQAIGQHDLWERVVVSSFHPSVVAAVDHELRSLGKGVPTALIYKPYQWLPSSIERAVARLAHRSIVHKPNCSLLKRNGTPALPPRVFGRYALAWTVNDPETARETIARGARGLIGDDPVRLKEWTTAIGV